MEAVPYCYNILYMDLHMVSGGERVRENPARFFLHVVDFVVAEIGRVMQQRKLFCVSLFCPRGAFPPA